MTLGEWLFLWFTGLLTAAVLTAIYIVLKIVRIAAKQIQEEDNRND